MLKFKPGDLVEVKVMHVNLFGPKRKEPLTGYVMGLIPGYKDIYTVELIHEPRRIFGFLEEELESNPGPITWFYGR